MRQYSEKVKPPRTIFVSWPFGHPFGEAFNKEQQRVVLAEVLRALITIQKPGTIIDLPYRLRGEKYEDIQIRRILSR